MSLRQPNTGLTPADWERQDKRYKNLDDYLQWDEIEGKLKENANILEHLNHVYIWYNDDTVRAPTVLFHIFDMISVDPGKLMPFACRAINKSLAPTVTNALCSRIRIPVDSCYESPDVSGLRLAHFWKGWINMMKDSITSGPDGLEYSNPEYPPWRIRHEMVKHITFYQDPNYYSKNPQAIVNAVHKQMWDTCFERYRKENNIDEEDFDTEFLPVCQDLENQELTRYYVLDELKYGHMWARILVMLEWFELQSFTWKSELPVDTRLFDVLKVNHPNLRLLEVNLHAASETLNWEVLDRDLEPRAMQDIDLDLRIRTADPEEIAACQFNDQCQIYVSLKIGHIPAIYDWLQILALSCPKIAKLSIQQPFPNPRKPFIPSGKFPGFFDFAPTDAPRCLQVTELSLTECGSDAMYYTALIWPESICSLRISCCHELHELYHYLTQNSMINLTRFRIEFGDEIEALKAPNLYWKTYANDMRVTFDFLRSTAFSLDDLEIRGCFNGLVRKNTHLSSLTTELFLGIKAHLTTLIRLSVLNYGTDFTYEELVEIGQSAINLAQLEISCCATPQTEGPLGDGLVGNFYNQGLWWKLEEALRQFNPAGRSSPLSLTILRSAVGPIGASKPVVVPDQSFFPNMALRYHRVYRSIQQLLQECGNVPITHFAYYSEGDGKTEFNTATISGASLDGTRDTNLKNGMLLFGTRPLKTLGGSPNTEPLELYHQFITANENWKRHLFVPFPRPIHAAPQWDKEAPLLLWKALPPPEPGLCPALGPPGQDRQNEIPLPASVFTGNWPMPPPASSTDQVILLTPAGLAPRGLTQAARPRIGGFANHPRFRIKSTPVDKTFMRGWTGALLRRRFRRFHSPFNYAEQQVRVGKVIKTILLPRDHLSIPSEKRRLYEIREKASGWEDAWREAWKDTKKTRGSILMKPGEIESAVIRWTDVDGLDGLKDDPYYSIWLMVGGEPPVEKIPTSRKCSAKKKKRNDGSKSRRIGGSVKRTSKSNVWQRSMMSPNAHPFVVLTMRKEMGVICARLEGGKVE